jgi:tetratricopeptide (TPR) repeat protein
VFVLVALMLATTPFEAKLTAALALEQEGQGSAALEQLEALVAADPTSELARLETARLGLKVGVNANRAYWHAEIARSLVPENPRAHYVCALALDEAGDRQSAILALEVALALRSDYPDARFRLAGLLSAERRWPEAVVMWRSLAKPDAPGARLQLALALEGAGEFKAAEAELKALTRVEVVRLAATRTLVALLERRGKRADAASWRKSLERPVRELRPLKPSAR